MIGSLYTWSAINPYFTSYLKYNGNPNIVQLDVFFIMPIILGLQYALLPIGIKLGEWVGARIVSTIGAIMMLLSYIMIKVYNNYGFVMFSICVFGVGDSMGFIYVIKNGWKYFPNRTGLISGIILGGLGMSSAILNPVSDAMINPDKTKPDDDGFYPEKIADHFNEYLIFIIIFYAVLAVLSIGLTFSYKPELIPIEPNIEQEHPPVQEQKNNIILPATNPEVINIPGIEGNTPTINPPTAEQNTIKKVETNQVNQEGEPHPIEPQNTGINIPVVEEKESFCMAMKSKKNILMCIIAFIAPFFCILLTNTNRAFGNLNNLSQGGLQTMSLILAFLNGGTRFVWGWLVDLFKFRVLMGIVFVIQLIISVTVYFAAANLYGYVFINVLIGLCTAGVFTLLPPTFNRIFGVKNGAKMFSYAGILIGVASVLGPVLTKLVIKEKKDYLIVYLISAGLLVIGLVLIIILDETPFDYNQNDDKNKPDHPNIETDTLLQQANNIQTQPSNEPNTNQPQNANVIQIAVCPDNNNNNKDNTDNKDKKTDSKIPTQMHSPTKERLTLNQ